MEIVPAIYPLLNGYGIFGRAPAAMNYNYIMYLTDISI